MFHIQPRMVQIIQSPDLKNQKVHKMDPSMGLYTVKNSDWQAQKCQCKHVCYERCALTHSRQRVSYSDAEKCFSCHTVCHSNGFKRDFKGLGNTELSTKEYKRETMKTE